jgi:TatD DNase family protein
VLIDTHCHLDASEFEQDRGQVIQQAVDQGVSRIVIPAVHVANFETVRELAHSFSQGFYALGIHPMYVAESNEQDLCTLELALNRYCDDPKLIAVGEIGLDFFIQDISSGQARTKQEFFYESQLALAQQFGLPVLLHVRRSQDVLLKYLRKRSLIGGCAHAFNGSIQQASQFVEMGFALGIGGAMTYDRALQIRRIAQGISLESLVLETDSPDIPPSWLHGARRNTPAQVLGIAKALALLRNIDTSEVMTITGASALRVCPRLAG